jgi:hypothetical protein
MAGKRKAKQPANPGKKIPQSNSDPAFEARSVKVPVKEDLKQLLRRVHGPDYESVSKSTYTNPEPYKQLPFSSYKEIESADSDQIEQAIGDRQIPPHATREDFYYGLGAGIFKAIQCYKTNAWLDATAVRALIKVAFSATPNQSRIAHEDDPGHALTYRKGAVPKLDSKLINLKGMLRFMVLVCHISMDQHDPEHLNHWVSVMYDRTNRLAFVFDSSSPGRMERAKRIGTQLRTACKNSDLDGPAMVYAIPVFQQEENHCGWFCTLFISLLLNRPRVLVEWCEDADGVDQKIAVDGWALQLASYGGFLLDTIPRQVKPDYNKRAPPTQQPVLKNKHLRIKPEPKKDPRDEPPVPVAGPMDTVRYRNWENKYTYEYPLGTKLFDRVVLDLSKQIPDFGRLRAEQVRLGVSGLNVRWIGDNWGKLGNRVQNIAPVDWKGWEDYDRREKAVMEAYEEDTPTHSARVHMAEKRGRGGEPFMSLPKNTRI